MRLTIVVLVLLARPSEDPDETRDNMHEKLAFYEICSANQCRVVG